MGGCYVDAQKVFSLLDCQVLIKIKTIRNRILVLNIQSWLARSTKLWLEGIAEDLTSESQAESVGLTT